MDDIYLPMRYDELSELDAQIHLRHCATKLEHKERVEFLLCEAGAAIPVVKRVYRTKPSVLIFLLRSGSIGREHLEGLRDQFDSDGYMMKCSVTKKKRLISRIEVFVRVDDPLLPTKGLSVFRAVARQLRTPWPQTLSAGYAFTFRRPDLPGRLRPSGPISKASYQVGYAVGKGLRKLID